VIVLFFCLLLQLLLGHVEFAKDGTCVAVGTFVENWDINGEKVARARDNVIEGVLGQETMSFVHLVFEQSVEAIFTSTCVVRELRIGVLFQLGTNFLLVEAQIRELILNFLEGLCVPQLDDPFVFRLAYKHEHNGANKASDYAHFDEVVLVKEVEVPFLLAPFLLSFLRLILLINLLFTLHKVVQIYLPHILLLHIKVDLLIHHLLMRLDYHTQRHQQ